MPPANSDALRPATEEQERQRGTEVAASASAAGSGLKRGRWYPRDISELREKQEAAKAVLSSDTQLYIDVSTGWFKLAFPD